MKTKIITFTIMMAALSTMAFAQRKVSFGLCVGANIQNITGKDYLGNDMSNSVVYRFNGGFKIGFPVADDFSLQSGLMFASKGAKMATPYGGLPNTQNITLNYLEIPLNFVYKPLLGSGHLILGFGPYAAYALSGSAKAEIGATRNVVLQNTVALSDSNSSNLYFKPFEMGANLFAGYEFASKFSFQLNAQLGLTKINSTYASGSLNRSQYKNSGFGISLGYRF